MFSILHALAALVAVLVTSNPMRGDSGPGTGIDIGNSTWNVRLTPDELTVAQGAKAFDERIVFENGKMFAETFSQYGFNPTEAADAPVNYVDGNSMKFLFTLNLSSNSHGKLAWKGDLQGTRSSGTLVWTKQDGSVWRFTFVGEMAAEESIN